MSEAVWPEAGTVAPAFILPDEAGREHALADFAGRWVVLYFYPKDCTSGCTTEAVEFSTLMAQFAAQGAAVIGVSRDTPASHTKFILQNDLTVLLLCDPDHAVHEAYGAWRLKKAYGKETVGAVRSTFLIDPSGVVRQAWPKVAKAAGHAANVLSALEKMTGG